MSLHSHRGKNTPGSRRPVLELLDARLCLSISPIFDQGALAIAGTREVDTILIRDGGRGVVAVEDGETGERWEFRDVERISVDAQAGDDLVVYMRRGIGDAPIPALDLLAGDGDDTVVVGLLLPAVQKVRDAAARMHIDLGAGNDQLRVNTAGIDQVDLDISAGEDDDDVAIGLLLPAVQKVRDAAARTQIDLGGGDDRLAIETTGYADGSTLVVAGEGDDSIRHRMFSIIDRTQFNGTQMNFVARLGSGNDQLAVDTAGVDRVDLDIEAGEGDDGVAIGLLVPAVQKVREAAARMKLDLGDGGDRLRLNAAGVDAVDLDVLAGEGDDDVTVGLLVPAVQKVREAAARMHIDLGGGNDQLKVGAVGVPQIDLDISAGEGDDAVLIGLLLPAVQKVRAAAARVHVDLGAGADHLQVRQHAYGTFDIDVVSDDEDVVELPGAPRVLLPGLLR